MKALNIITALYIAAFIAYEMGAALGYWIA